MIVDEAELAARARRAYERGRLGWSVRRALMAVAITGVALVSCPRPGAPAACAAALGILLAVCLWRGGSWARGARLGFLAGLAPCLFPTAVRAVHACTDRVCLGPSVVCLLPGVAAGLLLAWLGLRSHGDRRFWLAAATVMILAGAIGCLFAGLAGLAAMAIGILAGAAAPVLVARAA
jgi:hypothetical protein